MSLRIITGRASTNKSEYILNEIKTELTKEPHGKAIIYITPEQMTFQQEYALLKDDAIKGSIRAQVVSFSRLAWRVMQETGGATKQFISATGIQMMLRKIVNQRKEDFFVFKKALDKQGFITELEGIITEFKRHRVTPEMLAEQITYAKENTVLSNKLSDLHYIYDELSLLLRDKYLDGEDQLQLLAESIAETAFLRDAEIYLDGFYRFTPNEQEIIQKLLQVAKKVTVALTMDSNQIDDNLSELDLFYQTTETYHQLQEITRAVGIQIEEPVTLHSEFGPLSENAYFSHLESHFDDRPTPRLQTDAVNPIRIMEAVHPRAEIDGVIQEMLRLVREENYRYSDFVIYLREADTYNDLIETMFSDYRIPVFIDEKQTMLNHSLIEFIRSAFEVVESNWRYDAVFRMLKTGFIPITNKKYPLDLDAIDMLENYVLEYGIRRKNQWLQSEDWIYKRFRGFDEGMQSDKELKQEEKINAYRDQVVSALKEFDEQIRKRSTVQERCETIYLFLERLNIASVLEKNRYHYESVGEIEKSREAEQVWKGFIHLLDEMVEMIGEEKLNFPTFKATFEAGVEALEFSHVPPTLDHVIVGTIDQSRILDKKCAFLLGVNEGSWPMKPAIDGMINENEREFLKQFGLELAESSERILLDETFYMYLAFTAPTDYLWVSYVLSDNEGKTRLISPMISRLQELFPAIEGAVLLQDPDELQSAARFITTKSKTRAALTAQLARHMRGYEMEDVWWSVLQWYIKSENKSETAYKVLQSLFYQNTPTHLSKESVNKLYPKQVETSVSRLEMLYRCSYQHFVQYSLQLEERRTYKLDAPDIGQLFHEAIKTITEWVQDEGKDFANISKEESYAYAAKSMTHLAPALQHHILSSSNRYQFIKQKLEEIIAQAMFILSEQARMSGFSPVGIELDFGYENGLEPLVIPLPNDYELLLRGRIDRVDKSFKDDQLYLRIIDYKSSSRGLDLTDVYYGLALQMLTYLDVVLSQSKDWLGKQASPAGILYFHVHQAMLSEKERLSDDEIALELFKKYKMDGLITAETEIAKQMDTTIDTGRSNVVPIGFKKDGDFYAGSKVADEATFAALQQHMHHLIADAGIKITSGEVTLNPYENKTGNACTFCAFKSVCQFDPVLEDNNYRKLAPMKDDEVISKIILD